LEADGSKAVDINVNHPVSGPSYLCSTTICCLTHKQIKLTRLAIHALLNKSKPAVVALVASIAGKSKQYPAPLYSATKHAVVGFARSLGDTETLQGVKVVAISPFLPPGTGLGHRSFLELSQP